MNGLVKKFFEFALGNGIVIILGILSTPIVTRLIGPLEKGKADMFVTYTGLIVLLVTMGIDQAFIRYYNDEKEEDRGALLRKALKYPMILALIVSVISLVFYTLISNQIVKETNFMVSVLFAVNIFATVISNFALINIRMKQKAKTYSLVSATNKIAYLIAIFIFYYFFKDNYMTIILTTVVSNIVMLIFALIAGRNEWFNTKSKETKTSLKKLRTYGIPFIFSMGLTWVFQSADRIAIDNLIKDVNVATYQVGVYGGAMNIVSILNTIQGVFTTFWIPVAYERYANNPSDTKFFSKISELVSFFMLSFAAGLMALKDIVIIFLGGDYVEAKFIFPFLVMMPIMYTLSETTFLGINFKKQTKKHIYISAVAAIFNVIGNLILVPYMGAKGAAISTGLAYVVFFAIRTYYGSKYYKFDINYKSLVPSIVAVYILAIFSSIYAFNSIILIVSLLTFAVIFFCYRKLIAELFGIIKTKALELKVKK